jgi:calcineurin-like phosphoesterase family protein
MKITADTFVIADFHFGHAKIIKYCNRPFSSVDEMNEYMLRAFNSVVGPSDTVINLGDFPFSRKAADCKHWLHQLNGEHILVMGNHDRHHSVAGWLNIGFEEVYPYPIIYNDFWILSHEPVWVSDTMPYSNIHGHIHEKEYTSPQYFNASVERLGYVPIRLGEIQQIIMGKV